jgi:hypothetical protein
MYCKIHNLYGMELEVSYPAIAYQGDVRMAKISLAKLSEGLEHNLWSHLTKTASISHHPRPRSL